MNRTLNPFPNRIASGRTLQSRLPSKPSFIAKPKVTTKEAGALTNVEESFLKGSPIQAPDLSHVRKMTKNRAPRHKSKLKGLKKMSWSGAKKFALGAAGVAGLVCLAKVSPAAAIAVGAAGVGLAAIGAIAFTGVAIGAVVAFGALCGHNPRN